MHIKVIEPGSYDFGEAAMQMVKVSSRGLLGSDRSQLIKRASEKLVHDLGKILPYMQADEPLVHLIAIGATEDYGANRNGDGFKRACGEKYHDTFVKMARLYRGHKNKDRKISYGLVKASEYNGKMKRIELLVSLNGSEDAARRNGGIYADKEMEKLAQGKDIPVSMACKIPFDVCSYCHNQAITTDDYCWGTDLGGRCKAGGLRDNIGALVEIDGGIHQLHADNPHPAFFDISHVFRPADRIAYVSGLLEKAASANSRVVSGAALARTLGVTLPADLLVDSSQPANVQRMLKLAYVLADIEAEMDALVHPPHLGHAMALSSTVQQAPVDTELVREKFSLALRALADERVSLPLTQFVEIVTDQPREKAAEITAIISRELPGIYGRLLADPQLPARVADCPYAPDVRQAPPQFASWAIKLAADYGLSAEHIRRRASLAVLREAPPPRLQRRDEKTAAAHPQARRLAEEYALYKLAFLSAIPEVDPESPLTASLAVLQNYVES